MPAPRQDALLLLHQGLFDSEFEEAVQIGGSPCRATESKELIKVDFNLRNGVAAAPGFVDPISKELEPFIISVGEIGAHGSPEGGVILRADHGEPVGEHDVSSIETTPEVLRGERLSSPDLFLRVEEGDAPSSLSIEKARRTSKYYIIRRCL
jgi:hypothetical protein